MHFKWPFTICVVLVINLFISRIYTLSIIVLDFLPPQLTRPISPKNEQFSAHNDIFRVERAFLKSKPKFHFFVSFEIQSYTRGPKRVPIFSLGSCFSKMTKFCNFQFILIYLQSYTWYPQRVLFFFFGRLNPP